MSREKNIKSVIILGDHIQSLGVSRICKRLGLRVYLYNEYSLCLTRFSNTCDNFIKFKDDTILLDLLMNMHIPDGTGLLMPTNDKMVGFLSENYSTLFNKYFLSIPKPDITEVCFNKIKTYIKAKNMGIPIPTSYFPKSLDDLVKLKEKLDYPVLIKPAVMYKFFEKSGKKIFKCHNFEELELNYKKAIKIVDPGEIIIQEFLPGGAKNLFSFCSFCANKKIWGSFSANRPRQKPMDFGKSTTFARIVVNEKIEELSKKFLIGIGYFGISEVEFMYDKKSKNYKLIEINPRSWKWHTISNKIRINLIKMLIDYIENRKFKSIYNKMENIGWIERLTDSYVVMTEILKGKMKFRDYFKSIKINKEYAVFDKNDLLPFIMYLLLSPYLFFKR